MKRLVNVRFALIGVLSLMLGIFSFYQLLFGKVWVFVVALALPVVCGVIFACFRKKYWLFCLVAVIFVLVGFFDFYAVFRTRNESEIVVKNGALRGRVTDIGRNGEEGNGIYLENCTFEGEKLNGRVLMYVYDGTQFSTGDNVSVYGTLRNAYAVTPTINTDFVRKNVRYQFCDPKNTIIQSGELTLDERVRKFVYETTLEGMPQNADVAYALLTGDRNSLDSIKSDAYAQAGIIHLLAVSGLHVGFVVAVFSVLLKRLKLPMPVELAILLVPLVFYAYICNFAPSIVRAVVMTVCVYISRFLRGRYDLLSSLCYAALFILIVQPLYLFDLGFQLSALSVFGISTLYLQMDRWQKRRKMLKILRKLFQTVSLSFSCVCATACLTVRTFGYFVWLGILVNIVAIPLVFCSFALCFVGLLPSFFRYALSLADKCLQVVTDVAFWVQSLDAVLLLKTLSWGVLITAVLLFVVGGYVNLSKRAKKVIYGACAILLAVCVGFAYVPKKCQNSVTVFCGFDGATAVATSERGEVAVVGNLDAYAIDEVAEYLSDKKISSLKVYATETKSVNTLVFKDFCDLFDVEKVFLLDSSGNTDLQNLLEARQIPIVRAAFNELYGESVTVQSVYDGGLSGAVVKVGNVSVAVVVGGEVKTKHFAELRSDVNFYAVTCAESYYAERNLQTLTCYQQPFDGNFGANKCGNFTIKKLFDIIALSFWGN